MFPHWGGRALNGKLWVHTQRQGTKENAIVYGRRVELLRPKRGNNQIYYNALDLLQTGKEDGVNERYIYLISILYFCTHTYRVNNKI